MTKLVSTAEWNRYKRVMKDGHDTFSQATIVWHRSKGNLDYNGSDALEEKFEDIDLKCLIVFNQFRSWPLTQYTDSGVVDRESMVIQLNKEYLNELGYINADGYFKFDPAADRFLYQGQVYKDSGNTAMSQAYDDPLHFYIIVIRENLNTGQIPNE